MSKSYYFTLIFPVLLLFLGASIIGIKQQNLTPETFVPVAVLSVLFIIVQLVSSKFKSKADQYLLSIVIFLSSLSAVMILRLKPDLFTHQLMWIGIGLVIFAAVVFFADRLLDLLDYPYVLGIGALVIICSVLLLGTDINGNRNWKI